MLAIYKLTASQYPSIRKSIPERRAIILSLQTARISEYANKQRHKQTSPPPRLCELNLQLCLIQPLDGTLRNYSVCLLVFDVFTSLMSCFYSSRILIYLPVLASFIYGDIDYQMQVLVPVCWFSVFALNAELTRFSHRVRAKDLYSSCIISKCMPELCFHSQRANHWIESA